MRCSERGLLNIWLYDPDDVVRGTMKPLYEMLYWMGLVSCIIAAICLSIMQLLRSIKYGSLFHWLKPLYPIDVKLLGIAGILFLAGLSFFILGSIIKR